MDIIDGQTKKKGLVLLGVVRVSDRAVLASHATGGSGYTGAALKEVGLWVVCVGSLFD
jgi:hypothetical protein